MAALQQRIPALLSGLILLSLACVSAAFILVPIVSLIDEQSRSWISGSLLLGGNALFLLVGIGCKQPGAIRSQAE
jgi:hypothetical protein